MVGGVGETRPGRKEVLWGCAKTRRDTDTRRTDQTTVMALPNDSLTIPRIYPPLDARDGAALANAFPES